VTGPGLRALASLPSLKYLNIDSEMKTDETLRVLREIGKLHMLGGGTRGGAAESAEDLVLMDFRHCKLTDAGLKELAGFPNLRQIDLISNRITDAGLKELGRFKSLSTLHLQGTLVTDAGVRDLARQLPIRAFHLDRTMVTDAILKDLAQIKTLEMLQFDNKQITDVTMKKARELGMLHVLYNTRGDSAKRPATDDDIQLIVLMHTQVTDAGLMEFRGLKSLKHLKLRGGFTNKGIEELKKSIPNLEVEKH